MAYIKRMVMQGFKSFVKKTEIPFTPGINVILGPNGSGKCLTKDTKVQLADGSLLSIGEIVNSRIFNSIKTEDGYIAPADGTEIMCLDLDTYKTVKKPIKAFVKRTAPEKLLKIKTRTGKEIKVTPYHPLFVLENSEIKASKAEELNKGTKIAIPRKIDIIPKNNYFTELLDEIKKEDNIYIPFKPEFRVILDELKKFSDKTWKQIVKEIGISYYTLKGLLDKQSIRFFSLIKLLRYHGLDDFEIIDLIDELIMNGKRTKFLFKNSPEFSRFFGYLLAEGRLGNSSQIWFTNGDKEIIKDYVFLAKKLFNKDPLVREYKPNCCDVIIFSEPLRLILSKLGMASKTEDKKISNIILKHSDNIEIGHLLGGLFSGDGHVSSSKPYVDIVTKSKMLSDSIENCFFRLGILFFTKKIKKSFKDFQGEYFQIIVSGVDCLKKFYQNIPFVHRKKRQKLQKHLTLKSNPNLDLIETNNLFKEIIVENGINVKVLKKIYPRIDAYCYNQCIPSRAGLKTLFQALNFKETENSIKLNKLINSDIYWDEITSIEEIRGIKWVYDLCIEKHHNFIANGVIAHNSNVSDALCFVLGRLSIKSMRAAKAKNLIFMGAKNLPPAKEAKVEIVFDNSDNSFSLEENEISLKRIVRKNGQSIYKINNQTKTRQEVLSLLAQAGIDPNGFNIILQGEIQNFVRMHNEERRKVIEEVSGISIYEMRKEKSLKELNKTEEKLKEVYSVLRERTSYLNNLEKERQQALRYKQLQKDLQKYKASILNSELRIKQKELSKIENDISLKNKEIEKNKKIIANIQASIKNFETKIESINSKISKTTGLEQEKLNSEIANLRAEIAGLNVKYENYSKNSENIEKKKKELTETISEDESLINELQRESPLAKKSKEIEKRKKELEEIEAKRKKFYQIKSQFKSLNERIEDKQKLLQNYQNESEFLLKQITSISQDLFDKNTSEEKLENLKLLLAEKNEIMKSLENKEKESEKKAYINEAEIEKQEKMIKNISQMDICPLCKSKITEEHMNSINNDVIPQINKLKQSIQATDKELAEIDQKRKTLKQEIEQVNSEISKRESDLMKLSNIEEKNNSIKALQEKIDILKKEISELDKNKKSLNQKLDESSNIEQKYETLRVEVQEISLRSEDTINSEISFKQRELERAKISLNQLKRDEEDLYEELQQIQKTLNEKNFELTKKRNLEEELSKRCESLIKERDSYQLKIREQETNLANNKNTLYNIEQQINNLKIEKAKINAEIENLETELLKYPNIEFIKLSKEKLVSKLSKTEETLSKIGSVNMRSLEVYDNIKSEYNRIKEKAETITKEKQGILKIISEIDIRKKKTFTKTLEQLNEIFSRNFSQLSAKGHVFLELENKKEPFNGGVNIIVKTGHGKYFDVTSLSGGEQTIVALSLIFAIQELKPYCFYVLDEIDAALDKRNSQRLAALLKKYMQKGQYIIVSHNDEVISEATTLYGISMHEGVSKIISLKL